MQAQEQEQEQHPEGQLRSEQDVRTVLECRPVQAQEQEQHPEGQLHSEQAAVHPEVEVDEVPAPAVPVGPVEHPAGAVCTEQVPGQEEGVLGQRETRARVQESVGLPSVSLYRGQQHPVGPCDLLPACLRMDFRQTDSVLREAVSTWLPLLSGCSSTGDRSEDRLRTPIQTAVLQEEVQRPEELGVHPDPEPPPREPHRERGQERGPVPHPEQLQLAELHLYQRA